MTGVIRSGRRLPFFLLRERGSVFRAERGGGKAKRVIFVGLRPAREEAAAGRNGKTEQIHGYCGNYNAKPATGAQHDDAVREDGADDAGGAADGAPDIAGAGRDGLRRV